MDLLTELARTDLDPALLERVRAMLLSKDQAIAASATQIRTKEQIIKTAEIKIAALTLELAHHRRMRFACKSETLSAGQRDLFTETWDIDLAAMQAELDEQAAALAQGKPKAKRQRAGRQKLPDHLPRIEHRHEPDSCQCGQCGGALHLIGEDVSEQLDVEPARFFVHRPWPYRAGACPCKGTPLRGRVAGAPRIPRYTTSGRNTPAAPAKR